MHRLDIDALRSLVAVAAFAGVGRAANALHLSQSTVSGHLRRLERDLGVHIVRRVGRDIAFTAAGDDLLRRAHRIIALVDDAADAISSPTDRDIVVAASDLAATPLLAAASAVLQKQFPSRHVQVRNYRSENMRDLLHENKIDVALSFAGGVAGAVPVADVTLRWYATATDGIEPQGLVVFTRPSTLRELMLGTRVGRTLDIERECLDLLSLLGAVRAGVGITALPARFVTAPGLRRLDELAPPPPMRLEMAVGHRINPTVRQRLVAALMAAATA